MGLVETVNSALSGVKTHLEAHAIDMAVCAKDAHIGEDLTQEEKRLHCTYTLAYYGALYSAQESDRGGALFLMGLLREHATPKLEQKFSELYEKAERAYER